MEFSCLLLLSIILFSYANIINKNVENDNEDFPEFKGILVDERVSLKTSQIVRSKSSNSNNELDLNNFFIEHYERRIESPFIDDIGFFNEEMLFANNIGFGKRTIELDLTNRLKQKDLRFRPDGINNPDKDFDTFDVSLSESKIDTNFDDLSPEERKEIVKDHIKYRSKFNTYAPMASDMKYMEYSEFLEAKAKDYVQACKYDKNTSYGLNVYIGTSRNFSRAMRLWYSESKWYEFKNISCSKGHMCGHFTQMLWADSHLVGCARKSHCFPRYSGHILLSCFYLPAGNYLRFPPFRVGLPCTRCTTENGNLCHEQLCVTKRQCEDHSLRCSCKTECMNCAVPNPSTCRCEACRPGWDWEDCSIPCGDELNRIGKNCPTSGKNTFCVEAIPGKLCRKSCGFCEVVNSSKSKEFCCGGKICDPYHVLDSSCKCVLDCPSALCLDSISSKNHTSLKPKNFASDTFDKPSNVSSCLFETNENLYKNSVSKVYGFHLSVFSCFEIVICLLQIKFI
ncbi:hypothetical protein JTE90_019757 [Oedothorax gibbosus]|uniref:SCP domain-containing protein n=1 Tax=Oedothorax gibbosus TaxID=931172 RepID=A0AAV6UPH8_9ARAC|nr:hypothetical protein JTE90_019757 [Oedothorax gibbosus]